MVREHGPLPRDGLDFRSIGSTSPSCERDGPACRRVVGLIRTEGSMDFSATSSVNKVRDVSRIDPGARQDAESTVCPREKVGDGRCALERRRRTARGEDSRTAEFNRRLEGGGLLIDEIEGTVQDELSPREGRRNLAATFDVQCAISAQRPEREGIGAGTTQVRRILHHGLDLITVVKETAGTWAKHDDDRYVNRAAYRFQESDRRRESTGLERGVEFEAIGPGLNGTARGGE